MNKRKSYKRRSTKRRSTKRRSTKRRTTKKRKYVRRPLCVRITSGSGKVNAANCKPVVKGNYMLDKSGGWVKIK